MGGGVEVVHRGGCSLPIRDERSRIVPGPESYSTVVWHQPRRVQSHVVIITHPQSSLPLSLTPSNIVSPFCLPQSQSSPSVKLTTPLTSPIAPFPQLMGRWKHLFSCRLAASMSQPDRNDGNVSEETQALSLNSLPDITAIGCQTA